MTISKPQTLNGPFDCCIGWFRWLKNDNEGLQNDLAYRTDSDMLLTTIKSELHSWKVTKEVYNCHKMGWEGKGTVFTSLVHDNHRKQETKNAFTRYWIVFSTPDVEFLVSANENCNFKAKPSLKTVKNSCSRIHGPWGRKTRNTWTKTAVWTLHNAKKRSWLLFFVSVVHGNGRVEREWPEQNVQNNWQTERNRSLFHFLSSSRDPDPSFHPRFRFSKNKLKRRCQGKV